MKNKANIIFLLFFLLLIYSVPFIQSISEILKDKRVQVCELAEDAAVTPLTRIKKINYLSKKLSEEISALDIMLKKKVRTSEEQSEVDSLEEQAFKVSNTSKEISKTCRILNRYVEAEPDNKDMIYALQVESNLENLQISIEKNTFTDATLNELASAKIKLAELNKLYPEMNIWQMPILLLKNMVNLFWDSRYIRPFEKKVENNSVFADVARPAMGFIRYVLFNDLGGKAIPGKNGCFFYRPDVQYTYKPYITESCNYADPYSNVIDPELLKSNEEPIQKIVNFKDQLKARGIDLLVVVVPGKPSIYPELLNPFDRCTSFLESPSIRFISDLKSQGVDAVDLFTVFGKEKKNDSLTGELLYLRKDTHWRARGAWLAASTVAQKVKSYPWYSDGTDEFVIDTIDVDRAGDIAAMTTLPDFKIREMNLAFDKEKTKCYQVSKIIRDSTGEIIEKTLYKDNYRNSRILLLGDSYSRIYQTDEPKSAGWISHLAFFLRQPLATIVNDGGASTIVREILARKSYLLKNKNLVIWEFIERDIRYGEKGWKDIDLSSHSISE